MYRYARTRNRIHRVHVEGGKAYKVEQCNLDDATFIDLLDFAPEGTRCKYCWAGFVEDEGKEQGEPMPPTEPTEQSAVAPIRPLGDPTSFLAVRKGVAAAALIWTGVIGFIFGVVFSPDLEPEKIDYVGLFSYLDRQIETRIQEYVTLHETTEHHEHTPEPSPWPTAMPTFTPTFTPVPSPSSTPTATPTAGPTVAPPSPTPMPTESATATPTRTPAPTPTVSPSTAPSPTPTCFRPGNANGVKDRCRWPPDD